jgi:hypothetical protein
MNAPVHDIGHLLHFLPECELREQVVFGGVRRCDLDADRHVALEAALHAHARRIAGRELRDSSVHLRAVSTLRGNDRAPRLALTEVSAGSLAKSFGYTFQSKRGLHTSSGEFSTTPRRTNVNGPLQTGSGWWHERRPNALPRPPASQPGLCAAEGPLLVAVARLQRRAPVRHPTTACPAPRSTLVGEQPYKQKTSHLWPGAAAATAWEELGPSRSTMPRPRAQISNAGGSWRGL